jgi:iron complex transport system substrate-binding protein
MGSLEEAGKAVQDDSMRVAVVVGLLALVAWLPAETAGTRDGAPPAEGGSLEVIDGAGRQVRVPARPGRIVSLAPSVTEILFALGAGDRVVGVTDFCSYPAEAATRVRIGGLINPDLERIVSLKPDLAIATTTGNYLADAERIERLGVPVYTISTPTLESVLSTLARVGDLLQAGDEARRLVSHLRDRIERVRGAGAGREPLRTLFVIEPDPLIAPGPGTFIGEALAAAGAILVTGRAGSGWAQFDMEQVLRLEPELLLTPEPNRAWSEGLARAARWQRVPAVPAGHVFVISDAIQHPGPRLVDGIEEVAAIVEKVRTARRSEPVQARP